MQHPRVSQSQAGTNVPPEEVRAELSRILASPRFPASDRRREFLRFIVDETLAGRGDSLKGYSIALAVFRRDETFDPNADPVVRLEARRLRRDLDSYYVDAGTSNPVRISIPKGSYVPSFDRHADSSRNQQDARPSEPQPGDLAHSPDAKEPRSQRFRRFLIAPPSIAAAIAGVLIGWFLLTEDARKTLDPGVREPAVVVMPFEALGGSENNRYLAQGIRLELVSNLFRFPGFRLYALLPSAEDRLNKASPTEVGRDLRVTYIVKGSVRSDPEEIQVGAEVVNATTGQIIWTKTYTRPSNPQALIAVQTDLGSEIATAIGQPYGIVRNNIDFERPVPAVSNMQSYLCVLRAYSYRRGFARAEFYPAKQCLERAVQRDPEYSDAWAMLGWLHVDAGRLGYTGDANRQAEYEKALQATTRAATLQPKSPLALKALAATYHYLGRYEESERTARDSAALNPNDPEILAQLGWRLAVRGKFDEGIPILKRAIERSVNPPSWYYHLVAIDLYLKHDYKQMLEVAQRSALGDSGFSQLLLAIANAELGNHEEAQLALDRLSGYEPVARDPEGFLRRHGAIDRIVEALMTGLQKAHRLAAKQ